MLCGILCTAAKLGTVHGIQGRIRDCEILWSIAREIVVFETDDGGKEVVVVTVHLGNGHAIRTSAALVEFTGVFTQKNTESSLQVAEGLLLGRGPVCGDRSQLPVADGCIQCGFTGSAGVLVAAAIGAGSRRRIGVRLGMRCGAQS